MTARDRGGAGAGRDKAGRASPQEVELLGAGRHEQMTSRLGRSGVTGRTQSLRVFRACRLQVTTPGWVDDHLVGECQVADRSASAKQ